MIWRGAAATATESGLLFATDAIKARVGGLASLQGAYIDKYITSIERTNEQWCVI
jgi:hypothetical protein